MITLTFEQIRNNGFATGLRKLSNHGGFTPKVAHRVGRLVSLIQKFEIECNDVHNKLALKYAEKNEDGTLKAPENSAPGSFQVPEENHEKFKKEMLELKDLTTEFPQKKLTFDDLDGLTFSANEITALEPLISPLEEVTDE